MSTRIEEISDLQQVDKSEIRVLIPTNLILADRINDNVIRLTVAKMIEQIKPAMKHDMTAEITIKVSKLGNYHGV